MNASSRAVRDYVTGRDEEQFSWLADGMVQINATHSNLKQYVMELRLDLHSPISEVKRKLYTHNGSSIEHMELHLRDGGNFVCKMLDDNRPLGFYGVTNGMEIHVVDTDPFSLSRDGGLDDVSRIEKFRMSDEKYDTLENSLRAYKRKMQATDPNFKLVPSNRTPAAGAAALLTPEEYAMPECITGLEVGQRVEVDPGARRGAIKFIGSVPSLAAGFWIGVQLDEPLAKGDGSRGGVTYFESTDRHGAFVRPNLLRVGDFPPEGDDLCGGGEGEDAAGQPQQPCCGGEHAAHAHTTAGGGGATGPSGAASAEVADAILTLAAAAHKKRMARVTRRRGQDEDGEDDDDTEL